MAIGKLTGSVKMIVYDALGSFEDENYQTFPVISVFICDGFIDMILPRLLLEWLALPWFRRA